MEINDLIVAILLSWIVPLGLFVFYFATDPVRGSKWRRKLFDLRSLTSVSKFLLAQKFALILVVTFIGIVRFTGGFPGKEIVAVVLYVVLVVLAWGLFIDLRRVQLRDGERAIRNGADPEDQPSQLKD